MEINVILFIFGLAVGSFINVVSLRYNPNKFLLSRDVILGRSKCPHCGKSLRWYELIPLFSFTIQRGKCRNCGGKISIQYPVVELLSGLIFVLAPYGIRKSMGFWSLSHSVQIWAEALWIAVFLSILLVSIIDLRFRIIPDEINLFILAAGAVFILLTSGIFSDAYGSFMAPYAPIFGFRSNIWLNHFYGFLVSVFLFLLLIILTKGKAMGMGDLKYSAALGFLFGWPDVMAILFIAFIVGALASLGFIVFGRLKFKSLIPFGQFISIGAAAVFFFGAELFDLILKIAEKMILL